jgi:2-oxo-4-hydroxy-4-carboxy--5-ureidoimidazoline (OHCU) decarboxylase
MAARDRRPEEEILAAFEDRLGRDPAAEEEEALRQVERVLLLRLRDRC